MTRIATLAARLLSALCMLTVVLAWAGFAFGTESTWWIELARYLPYPVFLALALLGVLLAWPSGWRWRSASRPSSW